MTGASCALRAGVSWPVEEGEADERRKDLPSAREASKSQWPITATRSESGTTRPDEPH